MAPEGISREFYLLCLLILTSPRREALHIGTGITEVSGWKDVEILTVAEDLNRLCALRHGTESYYTCGIRVVRY
ncbi:hypothetical protein BKA93DRAFT_764408 [Sparassis latifolia]